MIAAPTVNQDQLWRLFDLVPGLDYCDLKAVGRGGGGPSHARRGQALVVYNNPQSAAYAKEKLHGFEYPPGTRMIVKFETFLGDGLGGSCVGIVQQSYGQAPQPQRGGAGQPFQAAAPPGQGFGGMGPANGSARAAAAAGLMMPPAQQLQISNGQSSRAANKPDVDLAHLQETIANATALLQAAGYSSGAGGGGGVSAGGGGPASSGETYDPSYCSVKLPAPQPLASMDSPVEERLFIVCTPTPPHLYALKDVFGRFGHLIDIYMLHQKTCGYAKYAVKESADKAVTALHGQEVCGSRLKVMHADPQEGKSGGADLAAGRKRQKISDG